MVVAENAAEAERRFEDGRAEGPIAVEDEGQQNRGGDANAVVGAGEGGRRRFAALDPSATIPSDHLSPVLSGGVAALFLLYFGA